ncbi:hypothetical protein NKT34_23405 [Paenibacillus polysaccharolyticus]|nr:hypothetical protein [Paenibacillus polysaccharolyticus]MCP1136249.1 hypothetical protein [Paenibacillus polysaccharolyticus]
MNNLTSPFTRETADLRTRMAEDNWNNRKFHWPLGSRIAGRPSSSELGL